MFSTPLRNTLLWANLVSLFVIGFAGWHLYSSPREAEANDIPWLSYPNLPFDMMESAVRAGHSAPMKIERCNSDSTVHIYTFSTRMINDDDPHALPVNLPGNSAIQLDAGCWTEVSEANKVPATVPLARYHFEGLSDVRTKYHNYLVPWRSKTFQVVEDVQKDAP